MKLTYRQKHNLGILGMWIIGVCIAGGVSFLLVLLFSSIGNQPAPATVQSPPAPPSVNSTRYEQISNANDETVDHYCVGRDGLFFGQNTGDFTAVANDPLCK